MGMNAVGAYLQVLREARSLSRRALARDMGLDASQIDRIEKGMNIPRSPFLFALVRAVQGNARQVSQLLLDPNATVATGEQLAQSWLAQKHAPVTHPVRWHHAQRLFEKLHQNPYTFGCLVGYAERLLEEPALATSGDELHGDQE